MARFLSALLPLSLAAVTAASAQPTAAVGGVIPAVDQHAYEIRRRELKGYLLRRGPAATTLYRSQAERMDRLSARVAAREAAGEKTGCSHEILAEAEWLRGYVMDPERIRARLDELERVLADPSLETQSESQDPTDGSWGRCHEEWFFKLNATYDHLSRPSNAGEHPRYKLALLDRVNSPQRLRAYLTQIARSDIPAAGIDHRRELNESLSHLTRLILRGQPAYYAWRRGLKQVLLDALLHDLRNPRTGWWGERYVRGGGEVFIDDLSITFHVLSYLPEPRPALGAAMAHLLAVKDLYYPIGWLEHGRYTNHNNMDVVKLFSLGWRDMSEPQRQAAAAEIGKMLDWCLKNSLRPDGSFVPDPESSDSLEEETSWGVSFLCRLGFFDAAKRFWTHEDFPQADRIRTRLIANIRAHLTSGGAGGTYFENALAELEPTRTAP
ncbi:MAG TPA: hypothetical protein VMI94_25075 [Bryobacteraceae bacterium]|nr:hypothetical protein [Bryobacteraceae bacterium]